MKKVVKYICYYDIKKEGRRKRGYPLSSAPVIESKAKAMAAAGFKVDIISMSSVAEDLYCLGKKEEIFPDIRLITFLSVMHRGIFSKIADYVLLRLQLLYCIIFKIKKDDIVLVYHSLGYMKLIKFLKGLKRFRLILEIQELYGDVLNNKNIRKKEMRYAGSADAYIFPTKILEQIVNKNRKQFIIAHGAYQVERVRVLEQKDKRSFKPGIIHCVYAGTLDFRKGSWNAVFAAKFLPDNYCIHIIGFGSNKQIEDIKKHIREVNSVSRANVVYDGRFEGEDYIRFIQQCDIGLCTQGVDEPFNNTSFPSKILSYLGNGLRVVSVRIPAIEESKVKELLYFYDDPSPESIARAILMIKLEDQYNYREKICFLQKGLVQELKELLGD